MNLLFYSTVFPDADHPSRGTYNWELCRALASEHSVRVMAPREWTQVLGSRLGGRPYTAGESICGAGVDVDYPTFWYPPKVFRERYGDCLWRSSQRSIERLARTFIPQGVLSYWAHPDGEAALRAARLFQVPAIVIVGGSDVLLLPKCPRRGARVRQVLNESDAVVTVSEGLREAVIDLGVDGSRVHTVYQGVNPSIFHSRNRPAARDSQAGKLPCLKTARPLILWVGRMVRVKRLDVLIDACAILRRHGQDFLLALAGDGPLRKTLQERVRTQGLGESVYFLGTQLPESLGDWYRAADCTVISSDSEGLPNVLRESLACGTPFVATDVGSIREIADERLSHLSAAGDPHALANALATVLDGPHQQQAREYEAQTWDEAAGRFLQILRECGAPADFPVYEDDTAMHVGDSELCRGIR